jgi:hypothetical protein
MNLKVMLYLYLVTFPIYFILFFLGEPFKPRQTFISLDYMVYASYSTTYSYIFEIPLPFAGK